jgi:hypothetical protein
LCSATSSRYSGVRSPVRGWTRVTASSLLRPVTYWAERAGRSSSDRRRCWLGIASLCGVRDSATTVAKILRQAGVSPARARAQLSWRDFLRAHADSIIACDFFTVETLWLGRLYVLFFLELGSRRVHIAGCTGIPDGGWTAQQARQLAWSLSERTTMARFLIHDRDSKFSRAFDEVFRSEGVEIIRTPFRDAAGERVRRALGRHRPPRLPRLAPDQQPQAT